MRIVKYGLLVIALLVGGVFAYGSSIPEKYSFSRTAYYDGVMVLDVWPAIFHIEESPKWNPDTVKVERKTDAKGKEFWRCTGKEGYVMDIAYEEVEDFQKIRSVILNSKELGFGGEWVFELSADPNGTRVTITENGEVYNPLMRIMFHKFMGTDMAVSSYLKALGKKFGKDVVPEAPKV